MKKLDKEQPADSRVSTFCRFPEFLYQNLRAYSVQCGMTQSAILEKALKDFLLKQGVNVNTAPRFFQQKEKSATVRKNQK